MASEKELIQKLFKIAQIQQKAIVKLAQEAGMPMGTIEVEQDVTSHVQELTKGIGAEILRATGKNGNVLIGLSNFTPELAAKVKSTVTDAKYLHDDKGTPHMKITGEVMVRREV